MRDDVGIIQCLTLAADNRSMDGFAPFFVWNAKDRTFQNTGMAVDSVLDFR